MTEDRPQPTPRRGFTRRDLIRKGAIVGGTLLWVAPAVQTLTPPAYAHVVSPAVHTCCQCNRTNGNMRCFADDPTADTAAECQSKCSSQTPGTWSSQFHAGPNPIACSGSTEHQTCGAH
jgi:hypothetical protein